MGERHVGAGDLRLEQPAAEAGRVPVVVLARGRHLVPLPAAHRVPVASVEEDGVVEHRGEVEVAAIGLDDRRRPVARPGRIGIDQRQLKALLRGQRRVRRRLLDDEADGHARRRAAVVGERGDFELVRSGLAGRGDGRRPVDGRHRRPGHHGAQAGLDVAAAVEAEDHPVDQCRLQAAVTGRPPRTGHGLAGQHDRAVGRLENRDPDQRAGHSRAAKTRLNGVPATRRKRVNPALATMSAIAGSPACAPSANPPS